MIEKPILFSGEMVRAILAGRKTQTRRLVTVPWKGSRRALPYEPWWVDEDGKLLAQDEYGDFHEASTRMAPYGHAGDRLWVKETFQVNHVEYVRGRLPKSRPTTLAEVLYRADGDYAEQFEQVDSPEMAIWRPSIFMPRWASRISLDVTDVRIERLDAITEEDAKAEGVEWPSPTVVCACEGPAEDPGPTHRPDCTWRDPTYDPCGIRAIDEYAILWNAINGKRAPWAANPWVWVVSFSVAKDAAKGRAA